VSSTLPIPPTIAKEQINSLPLARYEGPIEVVSHPRDALDAVEYLRHETVLGFDTESRPSFRRGDDHPVALLQLAGSERVFLFQLHQLEDLHPLYGLLADPSVRKVGVAIRDDIKKLQDLCPFTPANFVEISDLGRRLEVTHTGLRSLSAIFLGFRVSKGAQVTNWARPDLTGPQITYAATDAWVSRLLYLKIASHGMPIEEFRSQEKANDERGGRNAESDDSDVA